MMNPQMFQMISQARQNQNPIDLFKEATANYTTSQKENLFNRAKQLGVPDEYINQLKENINAK